MGHTAPIQCPACSAIQDVDLKYLDINDADATFSYMLACDCGYSHSFVNAPLSDVEPFVSPISESQRISESLGISPETYASYIWPPDVRSAIDKERRQLPESQTKRDLRAAALPLPKKFDDRWWIVYELSHTIVYDPRLKKYAFVDADGSVSDACELAAAVTKIQANSYF